MADSQSPNRRADERHPCALPGYFLTDDPGPLESIWWHCQLRDVSAQGCRLAMPRCLRPGATLTIDLSIPGSPTSYELQARVVHVTPEEPSHFLLGCTFLRRLTDSELEAMRSVADAHKGVWAQPTAKDMLEGMTNA